MPCYCTFKQKYLNCPFIFFSLVTLLNVVHLLKTMLDYSWKSLLVISLLSTCLFLSVLSLHLNRTSIPRKWLEAYHHHQEVHENLIKVVHEDLINDKFNFSAITSFPPSTLLIVLSILKVVQVHTFCFKFIKSILKLKPILS